MKSDTSRKEYVAALRRFIIRYKIGHWQELSKPVSKDEEGKNQRRKLIVKSCEEILKLTPKELDDILVDYILSMKKEDRSEGYVTSEYAAIKSFLSMNDVVLNWDKISKYKGEFKKKQKDEAYTRQQIHQLLQISNIRNRCLVTIFSSTGIRVGALPDLKLRNLKEMGDMYQFTIYEGYKQEYITFCTPECRIAIDSYLDYRKREGEVLTKDSPLIRDEFDSKDKQQVMNPRHVAKSTIRNVLWNLLNKAGLRDVNHTADKTHRKQIAEIHGFRKWFTSQLVNSKLQPELRWLLEGHSLKANDNSYVRANDQLYDAYIKAVDNLTIDSKFRLEMRVQELTEEKSQVAIIELEHKRQMSLVKDELNSLKEKSKDIDYFKGQLEVLRPFLESNTDIKSCPECKKMSVKGDLWCV